MLGPVARLQQRTVDWSLPQQQGVAAGKGLGARQGLQVCDWAVRGVAEGMRESSRHSQSGLGPSWSSVL